MEDTPALPVAMAFYSEMVVALTGQAGLSCTGFKQPLRQRNTGRNARAVHFLNGKGAVLFDILLLRRHSGHSEQNNKNDIEQIFHFFAI